MAPADPGPAPVAVISETPVADSGESSTLAAPHRAGTLGRRLTWSLLALILVGGAVLRFWAIDAGVTEQLYVHDEIIEVHRAFSLMRCDAEGIPGAKGFLVYFIVVEYAVWGLIELCRGTYSSFGEFISHNLAYPGDAILIGRITVSLMSLVSIWLMYRVGRRTFRNRAASLVLAAAWATCAMEVYLAHEFFIESCFAMVAILGFLSVLRLRRRDRLRDYALASFALACGAACKTYGVGLVLFLGLAHFTRGEGLPSLKLLWSRVFDRRIWIASILYFVFYFAMAPMMVVHLLEGLGVIDVAQFGFFLDSDLPKEYGLPYYLRWLRWDLGNLLLPFLAVGALIGLLRLHRPVLWALLYVAGHVLALGLIPTNVFIYQRYMLVALPFLYFVAVFGALEVGRWLARLATGMPARFAVGTALLACLLLTTWNGLASTFDKPLFQGKIYDIKRQVADWIEEEIPENSRIVVFYRTIWMSHNDVPIWDTKANSSQLKAEIEAGKVPYDYRAVLDDFNAQAPQIRYDLVKHSQYKVWRTLDEYIEDGVEWFALDPKSRSRFRKEANESLKKLWKELEDEAGKELDGKVILEKTFEGRTFQGDQRKIQVFRVRHPQKPPAEG